MGKLFQKFRLKLNVLKTYACAGKWIISPVAYYDILELFVSNYMYVEIAME